MERAFFGTGEDDDPFTMLAMCGSGGPISCNGAEVSNGCARLRGRKKLVGILLLVRYESMLRIVFYLGENQSS